MEEGRGGGLVCKIYHLAKIFPACEAKFALIILQYKELYMQKGKPAQVRLHRV